jgi:transcriptional regulator with XRE-family HTH domain
MNQGELAARLDVPQSLVSRFERGDRKLDLQELQEVCAAIGVPLTELVRRFENDAEEN